MSADLALYSKNLVSVGKHFSYVQLNFQGSDARSRPCEVKSDGECLGGSATQNWCLLRLLPVLVGKWIKKLGRQSLAVVPQTQ